MRTVTLLCTSILLTFLHSCSNKELTKEQAKDLISKRYGYPKDETITFKLLQHPAHFKMSYYTELIDSGYIAQPEEIRIVTTPLVPQGNPYIQLRLAEKGLPFERGTDPNNGDKHFLMKGAELYVTDVSAITRIDRNTLDVSYSVSYNINAFGRYYKSISDLPNLFNGVTNQSVTVQWVDDGWEIR